MRVYIRSSDHFRQFSLIYLINLDSVAIMKICTIFLLLFSVGFSHIIKSGSWNSSCPKSCECFIAEPGILYSGGLAVICEPKKSLSLPEIHPSVTYLDTSGRNIKILTGNAFRDTQSIEVLNLNQSHIKTIENGTFSGMKNLTFLNLAGNELETVSIDAFSNLKSKHLTSE